MRLATILNSQAIAAKRDDPRFYLPRKFNREKYGHIKWCHLSKMAHIPSSTITPSRYPDKIFNYVDLADVEEKEGEVTNVHQRKGKDITGGKVLFKSGDVIFARIEPSIFNRKYALVQAEIEEGVGSTEFYIARPKSGVSAVYLHWALRGDWVAEQLNPGILRGSTGRRRLSREDFSQLLIPDVSKEEQEEIEKLILHSRARRRRLLELADIVITKTDNIITEILYEASPYEDLENSSEDGQLALTNPQ